MSEAVENEAVADAGDTVDFPAKITGVAGGVVSLAFQVGGEDTTGTILQSSVRNWDDAWEPGDDVVLKADNPAITAMQMATPEWQRQYADALANQQ